MKAVAMTGVGDASALRLLELADPIPGPGSVLVDVKASGVNFMDIGVRKGQSWLDMPLPRVLGAEGAGRVLALGEGVEGLSVGQRVAWTYAPGSYAEKIVAPAGSLVPIPEGIDDKTAASLMMQGITASHFATDFYPVQSGDIALVHAAAGGLGQLLTQIIRLRGGEVIGRVSSEDKVAAAQAAGCKYVIVDAAGDFADEAIRLSGGEGVHVVFDGSGPLTFAGSLKALRRSGTFCWYGPVLGGPDPINIMSLPKSIKVGYAVFSDHVYTPELLRARATRLFDWVLTGRLVVAPAAEYRLADAAQAHLDMESRATTGKLLLIP